MAGQRLVNKKRTVNNCSCDALQQCSSSSQMHICIQCHPCSLPLTWPVHPQRCLLVAARDVAQAAVVPRHVADRQPAVEGGGVGLQRRPVRSVLVPQEGGVVAGGPLGEDLIKIDVHVAAPQLVGNVLQAKERAGNRRVCQCHRPVRARLCGSGRCIQATEGYPVHAQQSGG